MPVIAHGRGGEIAAMRGELSVIRGMLDGFRLERDRVLVDLEAAQMAQAEADAAADAAALRQTDEAGQARGRWARLMASWRAWRGECRPDP